MHDMTVPAQSSIAQLDTPMQRTRQLDVSRQDTLQFDTEVHVTSHEAPPLQIRSSTFDADDAVIEHVAPSVQRMPTSETLDASRSHVVAVPSHDIVQASPVHE